MFDIEVEDEDNCRKCETKPLNGDNITNHNGIITVRNVIQESNNNNINSNINVIYNNLRLDSATKRLIELRSRRERRHKTLVVTILAFGNFCVAAGVSIQGPFFPKEAELKGATPIIYSSIFSIYELVMLLTSFKFGQLVSKIPANLMCGFGLALAGISTVGFGLLDHLPSGVLFIAPAYAIRIIESLGATAFATSSYSLITYRFPETTATMFSIMETCFGLGLITGPVLGGALYEWGGYTVPFLVLGVLLTLSAALILMFLTANNTQTADDYKRDPETVADGSGKPVTISVGTFLMDPIVILDSFVILTALSLIGFNASTLEPHIRQFQLSPLMTGVVFVTLGLMYALTAPVLGKLCDIFDRNLTIFSMAGTVLSMAGLALVGPMPGTGYETNLWLVIVALLLFGVGSAAKQVSGYSHVLTYCIRNRGFGQNRATYGLVSGLFFSCISLGGFVGPTIAGVFVEKYDFKIATLIMFAIEGLLFIALFVCFITKKTKIL